MKRIIIIFFLFYTFSIFSEQKAIIAVLDFKAVNVEKSLALTIRENIFNYLFETGKYKLIERNDLNRVLNETRLSSSDLVNSQNAVKLGKLLAANGIILGSVIKTGNRITISARLVSVETGAVIRSAKSEFLSEDKLNDACKEISIKLTDKIPASNTSRENTNTNQTSQTLSSEEILELNNQLLIASQRGLLDRVKKLLKNGASVNAKTKTGGFTALMYAINSNNLELIKFLIENGANIESENSYGLTPIAFATSKNQIDIAKYLISKGADLNSTDNSGQHLTHRVVKDKNLEFLKILVSKGVKLTNINQYGDSLLHTAVSSDICDLELIKFLIEKGIDINLKDKLGRGAIYFTLETKKIDIFKYLIEKGANVDYLTQNHENLLILATRKKLIEAIEILLKKGLNINAKDNNENTALFYAVRYGGDIELVKFLIKKGANVNIISNGETPLTIAAFYQKYEICQELLKAGADVNFKNKYKNTALSLAKKRQNSKLIELLIQFGATE